METGRTSSRISAVLRVLVWFDSLLKSSFDAKAARFAADVIQMGIARSFSGVTHTQCAVTVEAIKESGWLVVRSPVVEVEVVMVARGAPTLIVGPLITRQQQIAFYVPTESSLFRCNTHQISGSRKSDTLPAMNIPRKENSRHFVSQRSRFRNITRFYHLRTSLNPRRRSVFRRCLLGWRKSSA
jgi:hypothetical protein